jgi:hypothetical protein
VEYVERDGAPEKIDKYELLYGARFTAEMERRAADRSAAAQQAYIERDGAAEGVERIPGRRITDDDLDALDEASFGTIGQTIEERRRFWEAVEAAEASPKGDRLLITPNDNPAWWQKATDQIDTAPAAARQALSDARSRNDGEPFEIKLPTDKAFALHQWAVAIDHEAPIEVSPGRGGRTQTRIIAELPHELDGRERLQVVRDFTDKLAEKGFPFWAVVHAPDQNNDARNYHVHIAYYDRPTQKITDASGKEVWDFEVQEERRYPNRTKYLVRPHQQNRLRETNSQEWIPQLRKQWETATNQVLEDAGQTKRYNLGTYESMGIAAEAQKHINPRTFNKERKGELTDEGPILARRQWDAEQDTVLRDHQNQAEKRFDRINRMADQAIGGMEKHPRRDLAKVVVEQLRERGLEASAMKAKADLLRDLGRVVMDRVMSRPKLILIEAMKQDEKNRAKGHGASDPTTDDRAVPAARMFGVGTRAELADLVVTVSEQAVKIDNEHSRVVQVTNGRLRGVMDELASWAAKPLQTVTGAHVLRLQSERTADPIELERQRQARVAAFQAGFVEQLKKTLPEFLEKVSRRIPTSASPAEVATPQEPIHSNVAPVPGKAADGRAPVEAGPTVRATRDLSAPEPAVVVPARQEPERRPRQNPKRPIPLYLSPAAVLDGRRSDGRATPVAPATVSAPVSKGEQAPAGQARSAKSTAMGNQPVAAPSRAKEQVTVAPKPQVAPVKGMEAGPREGAAMRTSSGGVVPPGSVNSQASKGTRPVVAGQTVADVAGSIASKKGTTEAGGRSRVPSSTPLPAPEPGREPAKSAPNKRAAPAAGVINGNGTGEQRRTTAKVEMLGAPTPATVRTPDTARAQTPTNAPRPVAATANGSTDRETRPPKPRYRGPTLPNIAAIMDEVEERRRVGKAADPVEPKPATPALARAPEEDEEFRPEAVEIVGAKRPPKKAPPRQRQRTRGSDFER